MISTSNISVSFGGQKLFVEVNVKFIAGNCYGLIGANGAGKSTFLKVLSGDLEPTSGEVHRTPGETLSFLRQDHFAYEELRVLDVVLMGNEKLFNLIKDKDALYAKSDFSDEDGVRASELEAQFAELNGWEAESDAGLMLAGLGISTDFHTKLMKELNGGEKVKVLLAQALFGNPDILLLDEPTNHLDIYAIRWLEDFLLDFKNTVIVVSHDRHFMNKICSHIADVDYGKIAIYTGNYEFWKQSSELAMRLRSDENKKNEQKADDLRQFIARFSANASKSSQATSRRKQLEKLNIEDLPRSSRRQPYVGFVSKRESGNDILEIDGLSKKIDGELVLDKIRLSVRKGDKIALIGKNDVAKTTLFKILGGEIEPDSGTYKIGGTITTGYFPVDNSSFFDKSDIDLVNWLRQYSEDKDESFIRGFLGKMLFSKEEANKMTRVLSGGERVRCVLAKIMLQQPNLLFLNEPTSHLDLESVNSLNEGMQKFKGSLIFTSHDHELVQTVANRIIQLDTTITYDKYISYDEYIDETRDAPKH